MKAIDIYALNLCSFTPKFCTTDSAIILKAAAYKSGKKQKEYLASEWLRRFVLKRYIENQDMVFDSTEKGRPFLKNRADYDFNISHTRDWIVIAVVKGKKIGIDIQSSKKTINALSIAKQYYARSEYQWLSSLPKSKVNHYFYLLWTLKEASLKLTGEGITSSLAHYTFLYKNRKLQLLNTVTAEKLYYYSNCLKSILLSLAVTKPIAKIRYFIVKNNKWSSAPLISTNITSKNLIYYSK